MGHETEMRSCIGTRRSVGRDPGPTCWDRVAVGPPRPVTVQRGGRCPRDLEGRENREGCNVEDQNDPRGLGGSVMRISGDGGDGEFTRLLP